MGKLLRLVRTKNVHGNILYMFDSWADPVVHLLLLKSSMAYLISSSAVSESLIGSEGTLPESNVQCDQIG